MKAVFTSEQTVDQVHQVAKTLGEKNVTLSDIGPEEVGTLLKKAGTKIGSVHFVKRSNGDLRKMCFRLHVTTPSFANKPKGKKAGKSRKAVNKKNNQMTVFDTNKVLRDNAGDIKTDENGKQQRGAWRTVPLDKVTRICVDGITYTIEN